MRAPARLAKDETTEVLATRKLQKDEIAIFEQIIDAVKTLKRQGPRQTMDGRIEWPC